MTRTNEARRAQPAHRRASARGQRLRSALRALRSPLGSRDLELDVIRGVAILLAMGWHLAGPTAGVPVLDVLFWPARTFGWAGVDLFFVLSGFLVGRLVLKEATRTGAFDAKRFLLRRMFKLWPVYYFFLAAQLVFGDNPPLSFFWQSFFHLQNYLPTSFIHLWSLAVEEHFYLVFALVLPLIIGRDWRFRPLMIALVVAMVVPLGLRVVAVAVSAPGVPYESQYRVDSLAGGVVLAALSVYRPVLFERLLRLRGLWFVVVAAAITWLVLVPNDSALMFTIGFSITAIGSAALVLLVFHAGFMRSIRALVRPVAVLGVYSYALYLWHITAATLAFRTTTRISPVFAEPVVRIVVEYGTAIAVAIVLTRLIEWPALWLRNRLLPSRIHAVRPIDPETTTLDPEHEPHRGHDHPSRRSSITS